MNNNIIQQTIALAMRGHEGQTRKESGLPYIVHPMEVASTLAIHLSGRGEVDLAIEILYLAAICHDLLEDTAITYDEIVSVTGKQVADIVVELTNTSKRDYPQSNRAERKRMDMERLSGVSRGAKLIKLVDRTCNLYDSFTMKDGFKRLYLAESWELLKVIRVDESLEYRYEEAAEALRKTING